MWPLASPLFFFSPTTAGQRIATVVVVARWPPLFDNGRTRPRGGIYSLLLFVSLVLMVGETSK